MTHPLSTRALQPSAIVRGVVPLLSLVLLLGRPADATAQTATGEATRAKAHVAALASAKTEGRLAGSAGERAAGDYLIGELKRIGARPLPGRADFRFPFDFTAGTRDGGSRVTLGCAAPAPCRSRTFTGEGQVRALSFSDNTEASGEVVFAGYGIVVPDGQGFSYDSYAGLDVKDKVVVVLRYFPEDAEPKTKSILTRYAGLRYKAQAARQRGAVGMIVVTGPSSPNAGETIRMTFDTALAGSGIAAVSTSRQVADAMFASLGNRDMTLAAAQKALDDANPHAAGFAMPGITARLSPSVKRESRTGANIIAMLPATVEPVGLDKPWVALGAHYDHLGRGDHGNSLASKDDLNRVHVGADDNASGSSAVLAVAEMLSSGPRKRHVLLQFWSGEELGLLGSNAYVSAPPVPMDQLAAYLNFDMVGRMQDNKLTLQATGTSEVWGRLIERANVAAGFDLQLQQDPYQPTDVATFNQAGVPCLNFFTGTHVDYHRPSDTADKINYEDLDRIVVFAGAIARRLIELETAPLFTKVEQQINNAGRGGIRVFTGTIPDYSTEVKGLLLSGVIGGGPAEAAGLQKGDVIVEIAGQTIANIYDYTYALEGLKVGVGVKVAYTRNGERKETTLTPSARR